MLQDTNRDEHWHTAFSNFTCYSVCDSLRWICSLKSHSATRRQNPIPIFARNSICITFVHVWWIGTRFDSRSRSTCSQTDEQMDQWLLVGTRCIVWWTPGGDEAWFAWVQVSSQKTSWRTMEPTWNGRGSRDQVEFLHEKWILECPNQLWNHVEMKGMPTATARWEIPTVPPHAPPPEEHIHEIRVHSNSGGGDVAATTRMVIRDPSYMNPAKTKVRQNILGAPISYLPNEDDKLIDTGQIVIAQKLQGLKNDIKATMVSWRQLVTPDRYITIVSTVTVTAVTYLGFEYRSVHDGERRGFTVEPAAKYVDECLDIVQMQNAKAVMTPLTEQKSLNLHDETRVTKFNTPCSELWLENCSTLPEWDRSWCLRQNACHTNLRHQHLQIWHVPRKCWDIWKELVNWISTWRYLHWNRTTWTRPPNTSRDILMLTGPVTLWRGKVHLALCVTLINFSWRVNVEDRELLPCPVENQKCMFLVHCQLSWFSHKLSWKRLDYHSWYTREQTAAQHARCQRNMEQVARWNTFTRDSYSFKMWYFGNCWRCHQSRLMWIRVISGRKPWDVNDSTDWDRCLAWEQSWARRVHLANGTVATSDYASHGILVWWIVRVEWSTHVSKRRIFEIFSVQRGTPRESDTGLRREEACLLNLCNVVAQLVTSQPVTVDTTVTFFPHSDVLGPSRITRK